MSDGELILVAGVLLAGSVAASMIGTRLRLPVLVLLLAIGMVANRWFDFHDYEAARRIGVVALALILFEGGLSSSAAELRTVLRPALALATAGTVITALVAGAAAALLLSLPLLNGLLLGSILASTDGTAVFALLRGSALRQRLARTLEAEAGLNDPVAILLVVGFIAWRLEPGYGVADMAWLFARELVVGAIAGVAAGRLAMAALRRLRLPAAGVFPVASLAIAALAYGSADVLHGSGFLAVYLAGLQLGGADIPARRTIAVFHEGAAWVAQVAVFVMLGLLLPPAELGRWLGPSLALAIVLMFIARPLAAAAATAFERFSLAERAVLAWAGMRGAVSIVLATFPVLAGVDGSERFFVVVFFVVAISTLVQGGTFARLARTLGVTAAAPPLPRPVTERGTLRGLGGEVVEHAVAAGDPIVGRRVRDLGLPAYARVTLIVRGEEAIPPSGAWRIASGDVLHLLVRDEVLDDVLAVIRGWRGAPDEFAVVAWRPEHGDPVAPVDVFGVPVRERLLTRADRPGALVELDDGRHAVTGPVVVVGRDDDLERYARRRLRAAAERGEQAWWRAVIGMLEPRRTPRRGPSRSGRRRAQRP